MRITVLGIRGIPNVQGGVETHAEQLCARLVALGCDVEVIVRTPFVPFGRRFAGQIKLRRIWSPRKAGLEALVHSLLGVLYAGLVRPDILHIHAVGPAIVTPIARLLGLKVVVTHHGPDYDRDKWGFFARWVLRTGERFGMRYSHARIAISKVIMTLVQERFDRNSELIPNGVFTAKLRTESELVRSLGLEPGRYFLQVSRMVPEKRQLDLIRAYVRSQVKGWKLALVGGLDSTAYSQQVQREATAADVILTGFQSGDALAELYTHAGVFVLPSSHEGLPIAMLEALSYGLPVIASDITANVEVGLDEHSYFPLGDTHALADALSKATCRPESNHAREVRMKWVTEKYDWQRAAEQTLQVYKAVVARKPPLG